ncbi:MULTISPECIES: LysR family transcriptional regulator [Pseudomonas]|jgi:LysR family glycine cleavage system transcriptional activator|uniref:HTH-type transcriptional regulator TrpI n=1 Tax=Pseudomonas putida TaxID=303 RepID=A0A9X8EGL8_PSEPU|nr:MULTISPECIES: LysR family transcriptional regulator [Pseudomonas]MEC6745035.1 LysR family transcriptional regulator [Pseudomonas qingdaonensis]PPS59410.1 LysR family transcriptional regulator [Pseudomonas sp. BRM28]ROQ43924.1 LysR family transcriptional regulator [Pseudomonas putida]UVL51434.1 LysR family transcriptional regulator [Pseudomonas sp. B21-036]WEJ21813.1 LysR family transcriptional regulator [Pseudomonas sp. SD17-1]
MRRKIPSTTALVCFEAAARHESFTKAAQELSLTQGAVCRQVGGLEEFLNVELFRRSRRGVKLTEAGLSYSRRVATQLDAVERDTLSVMGQQGANVIELALVPTFGTQWLLPRLKDFQRLHPEVTVNLTNRTRPFLFADTHFDAAIYFGDADWSGTQSHRLMGENPVPVCSPALLAGQASLSAEDLAQLPLLQQTTRPYAWRQWFNSLEMNVARDMTGPRYELFSMLAQAAMHEMGVALIPPFLIQHELGEGRLVIANPHALSSIKAYYLMIPERKVESASLRAFRDWLVAEAQRYTAQHKDQSGLLTP